MILYYLLTIPVLSILVFVHEVGHFLMAKRAGMKVEEFGFGFPPRIWGTKKGETTYSINWIPFGGFVKIFGEDGEHPDESRSFSVKPFWAKFSVVVAGVVMNFLLAALLFMIVFWIGFTIPRPDGTKVVVLADAVYLSAVAPQSPADRAGLIMGDRITDFTSVPEMQKFVNEHRGTEIALHYERAGTPGVHAVTITPRVEAPLGEGALGVGLLENYEKGEAIWEGIKKAGTLWWEMLKGFGLILGNLFTTGKAGVELAGPIGIAVITGQAAHSGIADLLFFMAFISVNLSLLNILPIPALDGGRLLFLVIEKIKGSPLPKKVEMAFNTTGFMLLLLLIFYISVKDVIKFF